MTIIVENIYNYMSSPVVVSGLILVVVIVFALSLLSMLGGSSGSSSGSWFSFSSSSSSPSFPSWSSSSLTSPTSSSFSSLTTLLVLLLLGLLLFNGVRLFWGTHWMTFFNNWWTPYPEIDVELTTPPSPPSTMSETLVPQVFNIPDNSFVYADAKAVCQAYGARLATYQEVEDAYNHGGEWCNYGWTDGQMALFPTQAHTYKKLQGIKGHENDCGRPGVNGGFMANPKLRFGVNCFGHKPRINETEEELMAMEPIYPKTNKDLAMERRVQYWKDRLSSILVSPFNHHSWSRL